MTVDEMLSEMLEYKNDENSQYNILGYRGSDQKYHYFGFGYAMYAGEAYKIPREQLLIQEEMPISEGNQSLSVWKIGNIWTSMRRGYPKNSPISKKYRIWEDDILAKEEGIIILIAPPPPKKKEE